MSIETAQVLSAEVGCKPMVYLKLKTLVGILPRQISHICGSSFNNPSCHV